MQPVLGVLLALAAALGSGRAPGWVAVGLEGAGQCGSQGRASGRAGSLQAMPCPTADGGCREQRVM